jgi:hyperosmotically inducible protein
MKALTNWPAVVAMLAAGVLAGCAHTTKSPDISDNLRKALDQAGLQKVTINQDRDKGVVTLGGQVATDNDKAEAEAVAKPIVEGEVVSVQIAVVPVGRESEAREMNSDLDAGIEHNVDAALIESKLHHGVSFAVKNHVVTLSGEVDSPSRRRETERVASSVPNVQQVVNELQVKNQKASSSH